MSLQLKACLLAVAFLAGCGSGDHSRPEGGRGSDDSEKDAVTLDLPTKEKVAETATSFVLVYLKAYDLEAQIDDYFGLIEPEAEFFPESSTWNVFFAGVSSLYVKLDQGANRASVHLPHGTALTDTLFSLSEFKEFMNHHVDESAAAK